MQTNLKVGDIVQPNHNGMFIYDLLYDRLKKTDVLRVDAVGSTMVRIKPVNKEFTFDMMFYMVDPVRTTTPNPIMAAPYAKSIDPHFGVDMTPNSNIKGMQNENVTKPQTSAAPFTPFVEPSKHPFEDKTDKEVAEMISKRPLADAVNILQDAADAIGNRAAERDTESERSMAAAVAAFNALHGTNLTEELGWQFMVLLKMSRAKGGSFRIDDYVDGAAYNALAGEAAAKERQ